MFVFSTNLLLLDYTGSALKSTHFRQRLALYEKPCLLFKKQKHPEAPTKLGLTFVT